MTEVGLVGAALLVAGTTLLVGVAVLRRDDVTIRVTRTGRDVTTWVLGALAAVGLLGLVWGAAILVTS